MCVCFNKYTFNCHSGTVLNVLIFLKKTCEVVYYYYYYYSGQIDSLCRTKAMIRLRFKVLDESHNIEVLFPGSL